MTRRSSTRALAREIYREARMQETPTPDPPSPDGFGEGPSLTTRVRALYEGSAVPVREIARLAGVTERTIYKYAAKHAWKPRYRWTADGARPRAWRPRARFAPEKGAGGRFIRRDDKGKPFAVGLQATDAQGAARAGAACRHAQTLAAAAQAQADVDHFAEERLRAWGFINRELDKLNRYRKERGKQQPAPAAPARDAIEDGLRLSIDAGLDWLHAAEKEESAARERLGSLNGGGSPP